MKTLVLRIGALCLLLPLGACMNMSGLGGDSKYACKAPEGVACDSVSGTYANALHNNLPSQRAKRSAAPQKEASEANPPESARPAPSSSATGDADTAVTPSPLRSQARLLRLWIKPWEDADGDLYDQGYVYVQVDNGQWLIDHVQRQIRDAYAPLKAPPKSATEATDRAEPGTNAPARRCCRNGPPLPGPMPTVRSEVAMNAPHSDPPFHRPSRPRGRRSASPSAQPVDTPAEQFANWLPYSAYLAPEKIFVNRDSMGVMLELMPQSGADERMAEVLVSLYANCPPGTGIQFHLFASPQVRTQLRHYANLRVEDEDQAEQAKQWGRPARNGNLFRKLARQRVGHLLQGAQKSLTAGFHYTIRDFRLMLSVAFPGDPEDLNKRDELMALRDSMSSTLRSASLPNRVCDAADLINWCALFTNPDRISQTDAPDLHYDDGRELRDQIVDFDTIQDPHPSGLTLWKEASPDVLEARFFSIKSFPERFALWQMGSLIGDLMQPALQYSAPFLLTLGVQVLDPNVTKSVVTANHVRATQNAKSKMADVMPDVNKKLQDWTAAADAIDTGGSLVSLYHQLALFTAPNKAVAAHEAANAIWRGRGFQLNADAYMHRQACWPACR
jgi:type IV conjugative transfer system lipoprotein TraV